MHTELLVAVHVLTTFLGPKAELQADLTIHVDLGFVITQRHTIAVRLVEKRPKVWYHCLGHYEIDEAGVGSSVHKRFEFHRAK